MQSDFEFIADVDEPLQRERLDEENEEQDLEQELMRAADSEFRESAPFPGEPLL
jgi:hypothetical protein